MSSPIVDWGKQLYRRGMSALSKVPPERKNEADPGMVKEANESFRKKGVGQKTAVAKSKAKRGQRKAVSIKRYGG